VLAWYPAGFQKSPGAQPRFSENRWTGSNKRKNNINAGFGQEEKRDPG
jgi:hypothetical protein